MKHVIVTGSNTVPVCATIPQTVDMTKVDSSAVYAYHYNPQTETLIVNYTDKKDASGNFLPQNALYQYFGISPELWAEVKSAKSLGSALYKKISRCKDKQFPYWKIENYEARFIQA